MKDEIKEILDKLNDLSWYEVKDTTGTKWIELTLDDADKLVHCISNLQEENSEQLDENLKLSEWLVKKQKRIEQLQQENEKLKSIMKECSDRILKELNENNHLSCGPALSINYKLTNYILTGGDE